MLAAVSSISFLIFGGLFINLVYPLFGYDAPLSTVSLIGSFSAILVILSLIAYFRNKDDFHLVAYSSFNAKAGWRQHTLLSPVIFTFLFPLLSILGTYYMEISGNNIILIIMLVLIPVYVVSIIFLRKWIPKSTYFIAIGAISVALLLMNGLPSHYLLGDDVHFEYYAFLTTLNNLQWDINSYTHLVNATLSTSILPTIYEQILGINTFYIYKVVYNLIFSLTPLAVYLLSRKYIGEHGAFLSSFFFVSQITFLYSMQGLMRQGIAILFFALVMVVLFDNELHPICKKALFLLFLLSMVVSHYTTAYICFFLMFITWVISIVRRKGQRLENFGVISGASIALLLAFIFMWYSQLTTGFNTAVYFIDYTFKNLIEIAVIETRGGEVMTVLGVQERGVLATIWILVNWITIAFMVIGVLSLMIDYLRRMKIKFEFEFLLLMCASGFLLALQIILPYLASYNPSRVYIHTLVLLAPAFVIGGSVISKYIRVPQANLMLVVLVLIAQFFCATYIAPKAFNVTSVALTRDSYSYDKYYVHGTEVASLQWLDKHVIHDTKVYCDTGYGFRFSISSAQHLRPDSTFFGERTEGADDGFVYLGEANIVGKRVYPSSSSPKVEHISNYNNLIAPRSKIYSNGGAEIWR